MKLVFTYVKNNSLYSKITVFFINTEQCDELFDITKKLTVWKVCAFSQLFEKSILRKKSFFSRLKISAHFLMEFLHYWEQFWVILTSMLLNLQIEFWALCISCLMYSLYFLFYWWVLKKLPQFFNQLVCAQWAKTRKKVNFVCLKG